MRRLAFIFMLVVFFAGAGLAQEEGPTTYGKLSIYSDVPGADIYVDAKFVGQDRATITNIPTGKHYVRVVKGEETIQSGIVNVVQGEETIIVAKSRQEQMVTKQRRPNSVFFFGNMSDLGYQEVFSGGTLRHDYKPQLGFGTEIQFNLTDWNIRVDVGFVQNYPAGIVLSPTQEAEMAVSSPYLNVTKNLISTTLFKIHAGAGVNNGIFSPGYMTRITIASRIGYQTFLEAERSTGENQTYRARLGYSVYKGESAAAGEVTAAGIFVQAGVAYQL